MTIKIHIIRKIDKKFEEIPTSQFKSPELDKMLENLEKVFKDFACDKIIFSRVEFDT